MDKEHPHTLAKLAALQARCDRLEDALMYVVRNGIDDVTPQFWHSVEKIIKGD